VSFLTCERSPRINSLPDLPDVSKWQEISGRIPPLNPFSVRVPLGTYHYYHRFFTDHTTHATVSRRRRIKPGSI